MIVPFEKEYYLLTYVEDDVYKIVCDGKEPRYFEEHDEAQEYGYNTFKKGTQFEVYELLTVHKVVE